MTIGQHVGRRQCCEWSQVADGGQKQAAARIGRGYSWPAATRGRAGGARVSGCAVCLGPQSARGAARLHGHTARTGSGRCSQNQCQGARQAGQGRSAVLCGADGSSMRSVEGLATSGADEALGRSDATCTTYQKTGPAVRGQPQDRLKRQDFWEGPKFGGHSRTVVNGAAATVERLGLACAAVGLRSGGSPATFLID